MNVMSIHERWDRVCYKLSRLSLSRFIINRHITKGHSKLWAEIAARATSWVHRRRRVTSTVKQSVCSTRSGLPSTKCLINIYLSRPHLFLLFSLNLAIHIFISRQINWCCDKNPTFLTNCTFKRKNVLLCLKVALSSSVAWRLLTADKQGFCRTSGSARWPPVVLHSAHLIALSETFNGINSFNNPNMA